MKEHVSEDYDTLGTILALSTLQNGPIPRFLKEEHLQELFFSESPSPCIDYLRKGFRRLGLYQIGNAIPNFLHLFRPSQSAALTRRKLLLLLHPQFSESGSNARRYETEIYNVFSNYTREAASGQRGTVNLESLLQFITGTNEEPALGFGVAPSILFVPASDVSEWAFVPQANTCANTLFLPVRSQEQIPLPSQEKLFEVYDFAFVNAYFGNN